MSEVGTTYGYCRVSTGDQNHDLQIDALLAVGVSMANIRLETISGGARVKPELDALRALLKPGDRLVVWKVDRLGRSVLEAMQTARDLDEQGVHIVITTLGVDLKTPAGRLVFGMMAQIAEFEKELTHERVMAGLAAARARGTILGRRPTLTKHQRQQAAHMINIEGKSLGMVAATFGCAKSVVHRAAQAARSAA